MILYSEFKTKAVITVYLKQAIYDKQKKGKITNITYA